MNRVGLGLAVGAGYVLGRTKKMKLAFAVGTMVAGKRMNLGPRALADLVSQQLRNNPQFKEIGDQLREDLRGVGKAATGALVERRIEGLADRLHARTAQVRDQLSGAAPGEDDREDDADHAEARDEYDDEGPDEEEPEPPRKKAAKKAPAKKAPAKKTAAPAARKGTAKKAAAKKTATRKTTPAKKTARKTTRSRATRGGGGDD